MQVRVNPADAAVLRAARVAARARAVADLDARIADLQAMRAVLARLVATCEQRRHQRECPILRMTSAAVTVPFTAWPGG